MKTSRSLAIFFMAALISACSISKNAENAKNADTFSEDEVSLKSDFEIAESLGLKIYDEEDLDINAAGVSEEVERIVSDLDDKSESSSLNLFGIGRYNCFARIMDCDKLKSMEGKYLYIARQYSSSQTVCKSKVDSRFRQVCGGTKSTYASTVRVESATSSSAPQPPKGGSEPTTSVYVPLGCKNNGNQERYLSCRSRNSFTVCNNVYCKSPGSSGQTGGGSSTTNFYVPIACTQVGKSDEYKSCRGRGNSLTTCKNVHCK
jgi:hypothetical protein